MLSRFKHLASTVSLAPQVGVSWVVSDGRTSPMLMSNAILTLDEDQYPAQADATYDTALKRGWDITYARLAVEGA